MLLSLLLFCIASSHVLIVIVVDLSISELKLSDFKDNESLFSKSFSFEILVFELSLLFKFKFKLFDSISILFELLFRYEK